MLVFEAFEPTMSEHDSGALLLELWKTSQWRCYVETRVRETPALIEQFMTRDATSFTVFSTIKPTARPSQVFHWRSPNGVIHQGLLYVNGAIYRQADLDSGRVVDLLLVEEEMAAASGYPPGWTRLCDMQNTEKDSPS